MGFYWYAPSYSHGNETSLSSYIRTILLLPTGLLLLLQVQPGTPPNAKCTEYHAKIRKLK